MHVPTCVNTCPHVPTACSAHCAQPLRSHVARHTPNHQHTHTRHALPWSQCAPPAIPLQVIDTYPNLGPIIDMCTVDMERQGQCQIVTCSGVNQGGSLRVVRSGIGVVEQASVELPGIKGVWSLRAQEADTHDTYLVLSFVGETRVLAINAEEELDEETIAGFDADAEVRGRRRCARSMVIARRHRRCSAATWSATSCCR